ncbi:hypothetical protein F5882DRAFT_398617 [Hyaloscypha sp. PMI_1271]|nr:hypothetical protein F5882DRAFT_398617 [Hyaloscypha sp. PMI_1271]
MQTREFCREWAELVHRLEVDSEEHIQLGRFMPSETPRNHKGRVEEMNASFNRTRQRMDLLAKLLYVLSGSICEWDTFISPDGGLGYFSDLNRFPINSLEFPHPDHPSHSLRSIKQTFRKLGNESQRLIALEKKLSSDLMTLKLLLSLEGNASVENSAFLSNFTIWVLYPFLLSTGIFSMQHNVVPFDLTFRWFIITMLIIMCTIFIIHFMVKRWSSWRIRLEQRLLWPKDGSGLW